MLKQRSLITTSMLLAAVSTIGATATTANSNFVSGTGLSSPEIENSRKLAVMDVFIDDFAAAMVQKSAEKILIRQDSVWPRLLSLVVFKMAHP